MDIGSALREARERRGLSLEQLAQVTKIRIAVLEAIEADEVDAIPEVFLRGFVRAYAREVGLNPEDVIGRYLAEFDRAADEPESGGTGPPTPAAHVPPAGSEADPEEAERRQVRYDLRTAVVMLVIGAMAYYAIASWRSPSASPASSANAVHTPESTRSSPPLGSAAPATSGAVPEAVASDDAAPATIGSDIVHLEISARAPCWLSATVDGSLVVYQLLQPGAQHAFDIHDEAILRVGEPAAIDWSLNGQQGRPLGRAGEAVTVRINLQNYREFAQRSPSL